MRLWELKVHTALNLGKFQNRRSRDKSCSDRLRINTLAMVREMGILRTGVSVSRLIHKRTLLHARKDLTKKFSNREVTDKPKSVGHFTNSASVANTAGTMLFIEIDQATKRGLTREMTDCDKGSTGVRSSHPQTRSHTRWMNAMTSHNSCTLHTCAQVMKSPFSHATPLLILKRSRCLRLFTLRSH